ncbi:MAG: nucleoside deaminase, partial [Christensenellaceae bacterium]
MKRLTREEKWMKKAIREAKKADEEGEVPIGAVVVLGDKIVGRGHNKRTKLQLATAHAELMAIDRACKKLGNWRIPECELFVTL